MKLITRDTDYAIRALCFIAGCNENIVSVSTLSEKLKIPRPFLRKILQMLNRKRVLKSHRGQGGGFSLAIKPNEVFLIDLMAIFQGPVRLNECLFKKKTCPEISNCLLKKKLDVIEKEVVTKLKSITIASLFRTFKKGD